MSTWIGIGTSKEKDSLRAAREAALLAKVGTKQDKIDLALIFCSVYHKPTSVLSGIQQIMPEAKIIGCSSFGVIVSEGIDKYGVAVLAIKSDNIKFSLGCSNNLNEKNARLAGQELATTALSGLPSGQRDIFMMFSDGLINNSSELTRGVQDILGKSFPLIGAAASDDFKFAKTYQYCQNNVFTNSATGVLLGGVFNFGFGVKHGWKPLGKPHVVTDAEGTLIKKIDHKPAIAMYEAYFGAEAQSLYKMKLSRIAVLYPLGINTPGEDEFILRNVIEADKDGALSCQGDVPVGAEINLMIGSKDSCIEAAKEAALEAKKALKEKPASLIIVFDSISRNKLLGRTAFEEIRSVKEILGRNSPLIGLYCYGEIAPLKALDYRGRSYFHNETIAILAIA
ncbi:MAG: FIST N-terminal domain-containing protein [Candidatus Omnitrophota bacterium]